MSRQRRRPVLALFLPPFSPDFMPIEAMFNCKKSMMQYVMCLDLRTNIEDCLWSSLTPEKACNIFEHRYLRVTPEERTWVTR